MHSLLSFARIDWVFRAVLSSSPMKTIGSLVMVIGKSFEISGSDLRSNLVRSLKWHYEVFRWFDEYVGDDVSQ